MSVTKNDMVIDIAQKTNIEQQKVKQVVQLTLDGIIDILTRHGRIELRNFGVFEVRERKARKARNPRTGEEVMVASKRVVTFKAGKIMEERIANSSPNDPPTTPQPPAQAPQVQEPLGAPPVTPGIPPVTPIAPPSTPPDQTT